MILPKIMKLIPEGVINFFKIIISYACILLCINCKEKCIDNDEINNNESPDNTTSDETNYNSIKKDKQHKVLEAYENKIIEKINKSDL